MTYPLAHEADPDWPDTPTEILIVAVVYDRTAGTWSDRLYRDVKKGDIFRSRGTDGDFIHPFTEEPDDQVVTIATGDALVAIEQTHGYCVPIEVFDSLELALAKGNN